MRQLTKEQIEFVAHLNSPEWREAARKQQEAEEELRKVKEAEYVKLYEEQLRKREELDRQQRAALQPLMDALTKAGIRIELSSYDGVWGRYQIGDGPIVSIESDYLEVGNDEFPA